MRTLKLAATALFFAAVLSFIVLGDRLGQGEAERFQAPVAETFPATSDPNATPTHTPTPEPTGIDTTAPQILSVEIVTSQVDTTSSSQPITVTARITDDLSGLQRALLRFRPATGGTQYLTVMIDEGLRVSGDRRDGIYVASEKLPKYAAHGRWYLSEVALLDNAINSKQHSVIWQDENEGVEVAADIPPVYFINGEDSGPAIPVTVTPVPLPWAGEILLPLVSD